MIDSQANTDNRRPVERPLANPPAPERRIDDINLAGALVASGEPVARIAWHGGHASFVFHPSSALDGLIAEYYTGRLVLPARGLVDAIRGLKSALVAAPAAGGGR